LWDPGMGVCMVCGGGQGRCDAFDAVCTRGDAWVGVYVECVVMIGRMRSAMMSGGSWVSRSLDVIVVRMADVYDCVDRRLVRPRCSSLVRRGMWGQ
jgi:hypothetical protein